MIQQEQQQVNNQNENPDETAAVLSFATRLSEGLLPKAPQMQEMGSPSDLQPEQAQSSTQSQNVDLEANNKEMEGTMDKKLDELRKEIKETIKDEIESIKDSIKEVLEDGEE
jgi:hypothetical protein